MGSFESPSLGRSWGMVKARTGFESAICLEISREVLRGFVVVIMAPRDMTARQTMGKYKELGLRRRTTSFLRMFMSMERQVATASTALQTSEKLSSRPVEASMNAILPRCDREDMKVVTSRESFEGKGICLRLL